MPQVSRVLGERAEGARTNRGEGAGTNRGGTVLTLLRGFGLCHNGQRVSLPMSAQRLVAFLALRRGVVQRVYLAGALWLDYSQDAANANLRTALWRLKQLPCSLVEPSPTHLTLSDGVAVDLYEQTALARRVKGAAPAWCDDELDGIVTAGELLPDWYDDWVVIERERFRQVRLHALEALCAALTEAGRFDRAIDVGLSAVADEPLRESAHRAVIRVHLAEGNRSEALRQYELCRQLLMDQLGVGPSPETDRLLQRCAGVDVAVTDIR